jgi:hypothetical protein
MKKFLPISLLLVCCYSENSISEVFFDEKFETGATPFSFDSDNIDESPGAFTGERVYTSTERGYVWRNTFHSGCNDTYFGHRKMQDEDWNISNTFHWRAYVKFGDSDNSPEWRTSAPVNTDCHAGGATQRSFELKFPDIGGGQNLNLGRIIGKMRSFPGGGEYQGMFRVYTPDGTNHNHTDQGAAPFVSNRWYAIEFMVEDNGDNDTVKIWINNNDQNNPDYSYTGGDMFDSSEWSTGLRWDHGYRNHHVPTDTNFYYDNVVVSDSFIGLEDNTQPNPVSDLSENSYVVLNPALASAMVVSLEENNTITAGNQTLDLDLYASGTLSDLSPGMIITGTGPFDLGSNTNGTDMPVHASMLGTTFAMPHDRYSHIYHMVSPSDDASVSIDINGVSHQIGIPQGEVVNFDAGAENGSFSAVIRSDVPILVSHVAQQSTNYTDAAPMPYAATELWGVKTRNGIVTAVEDDTQVTLYASGGTRTNTLSLNAGESRYINVGVTGWQARQGLGSAVHLIADKPISAVQIADHDGAEQTSFYPTDMLNTRFGIPQDTQYVAIACPKPDTSVTLYRPDGDPETVQCSADGNYPGKAYFGQSYNGVSIRQGSYLESTKPVYVIYEVSTHNDEHNLMGASAQPLFSSDMEGSDPASSWSDVRIEERGGEATITFVSDGESQVAQFNYSAGDRNNVWLRKNFGSHPTVNEPPIEELWINFVYKVNNTDIYNPNENRSNKILLVNWSNPDNSRRSFQVQVGAYNNGSAHVFGLEKSIFDRNTGAWQQGGWLGEHATTPIPSEEKLYLQLHIRNSTNGEANGLVELYNDGELIAEQRDAVLNDSYGDYPDHMILTPYISDSNGLVDGYSHYDNVELFVSDPGAFRAPR